MNIRQIPQADYLDILFDGRNKAYGAFELRRNYERRTKRALAAILGLVSIVSAYPLFASTSDMKNVKPPVVATRTMYNYPPIAKPKEIHQVTQQQASAPKAVTVAITIPKIVHNTEVETPPVRTDSIGDRKIGSQNNSEGEGGIVADFGQKSSPEGKATVDVPVKKSNDIVMEVDQDPEFKGDLGNWLSDHLEYPEAAREANVEGKVVVQFVVAEDGAISDVKVLGGPGHGLDAEAARVVKMMPRWKPGKLNGEAVRTLFKLPVQFILGE